MGDKTGISYVDHTWNPWQGCRKVSEGCRNCYMYREKKRYGQDPTRIHRSSSATFNRPLHWEEPGRVFVCSWSDFWLKQEEAPGVFDWRGEAIDIMRRCPQHQFFITTKRPRQMIAEIGALGGGWTATIGDNVWLGVTAENQRTADERIPVLLDTPAAHRWLSIEPLLGPVDLQHIDYKPRGMMITASPPTFHHINALTGYHFTLDHKLKGAGTKQFPCIDYVIVGCESGPNRRPCDPEWIRSIIVQCDSAGVPVHIKQMDIEGKVVHDPALFPEWARRRDILPCPDEEWVDGLKGADDGQA